MHGQIMHTCGWTDNGHVHGQMIEHVRGDGHVCGNVPGQMMDGVVMRGQMMDMDMCMVR